jgi:hypothetical protein
LTQRLRRAERSLSSAPPCIIQVTGNTVLNRPIAELIATFVDCNGSSTEGMQYILLHEQTRRVALISAKQASARTQRVVFIPCAAFLVPCPIVEKRHACPVSSSFLLTGTSSTTTQATRHCSWRTQPLALQCVDLLMHVVSNQWHHKVGRRHADRLCPKVGKMVV